MILRNRKWIHSESKEKIVGTSRISERDCWGIVISRKNSSFIVHYQNRWQIQSYFTLTSKYMCKFILSSFTINPLSISGIHHLFRKFTKQSFSRIRHESTIFCGFIVNQLSISRMKLESTIFFANSLWIHHLFFDTQYMHYLFAKFSLYPLSVLRIHYEFTIHSENSASIDYLAGIIGFDASQDFTKDKFNLETGHVQYLTFSYYLWISKSNLKTSVLKDWVILGWEYHRVFWLTSFLWCPHLLFSFKLTV